MMDFELELVTVEIIVGGIISGYDRIDKEDVNMVLERCMVISQRLNEFMVDVDGMKER